jgi:ubiquinone/menaquinone biosynthesis C-methylase UbiE
MSKSYWNTPAVVTYWAERTNDMTLAERLAWLDVLRRNLKAGRRRLKALDVGTGSGFMALLLSELRHDVTGLDYAEAMLDLAQQRGSAADFRGEFVNGNAGWLNFEDETFDVVTARYVVSTLPEPQAALGEWLRVLKPGGQLILIEDDVSTEENHRQAAAKTRLLKVRQRDAFSAAYDGMMRAAPLAAADTQTLARTLEKVGYQVTLGGQLAGQLLQQESWLLLSYALPYALLVATKPDPNAPIDLPVS